MQLITFGEKKVYHEIPPSMNPEFLSTNFETLGKVRLVGFQKPEQIQRSLQPILSTKFLRAGITSGEDQAHHQFNAFVEIVDLPTDNPREFFIHHLNNNPAPFAIYVINVSKPIQTVTQYIDSTERGIAIQYQQGPESDIAYTIGSQILEIISDIFDNQILFMPPIDIKSPEINITIYQPSTSQNYDVKEIINSALINPAKVNYKIAYYENRIYDVATKACEYDDDECVAGWLKELPESKGGFTIFLMSENSHVHYADDSMIVCPVNDEALTSLVRKSLFAFESNPIRDPFFRIIGLRNLAVPYLSRLYNNITSNLDEITELFNAGVLGSDRISHFDELYTNFTQQQNALTKALLDLQPTSFIIDQLDQTVDTINVAWNDIADSYVKKRQCVQQLVNLGSDVRFFLRPTFYFFISIFLMIFVPLYTCTHIEPKKVATLLRQAAPLL